MRAAINRSNVDLGNPVYALTSAKVRRPVDPIYSMMLRAFAMEDTPMSRHVGFMSMM
jgi:hypothetical protein